MLDNNKNKKIRVAGIITDSIVDGPGLRFTIFVQGCPLSCEGCHNPQTQSFDGGTLYSVEELLEKIKSNPLLDGVTFSGGEPLCQAENLLPLAKEIKKMGLNLAIYTGFVFEKLITNKTPKHIFKLLQLADVLIDGPFIKSLKNIDLKFRGSSNQRILNIKESLIQKRPVLELSESWN